MPAIWLSIGRVVQVAHWTVSVSKFPVIRFTIAPARIEPMNITATYANVARLPISEAIVAIDTALMAGPVIKKTKAEPGDRPFIIHIIPLCNCKRIVFGRMRSASDNPRDER